MINKADYVAIISGFAIRILIGLVSSHPYDTAQFAISQRLYFQYGIVDIKYFPTMPLLYYVQLPFYSIYTLLERLGLPDYQQFYRSTLMIEGVFLKLPLILCDLGTFFVIRALTQKRIPALLYFFNPFIIYLSSGWGMYDSLMIFPLVTGFLFFQKYAKNGSTGSTIAFVVSGMAKLLGFLPFAFVFVLTLVQRRFKEAALQLGVAIICVIALVSPIFFVGGLTVFLVGKLQFIGLGVKSLALHTYNPIIVLVGPAAFGVSSLEAISLFLLPVYVIKTKSVGLGNSLNLNALVQCTLVAAIILNIFAITEVEWVSWIIPLGILYGSLTKRIGLQYFTFVYGTMAAFVAMTLTQGTGYLLGTSLNFLLSVEAIPNGLQVYAVTILTLFLLTLAYVIHRPVKFKPEIIALTIMIYLQAYFWFSIVGIHNL